MVRARKPARYPGEIKMESIKIPNCPPEDMRELVNALPFLAYHVENLSDGRKVCITKPGGKSPFGRMKVNDFMVWIYDEGIQDRWRISHEEIRNDIASKLEADRKSAIDLIDVMHRVCKGEEPANLGGETLLRFEGLPGLSAELILKVYKWIWIQEDCNYPTGLGRWMSMNGILEMRAGATDKDGP